MLGALVSGCGMYQYMHMESSLKKETNGASVFENDSVRLEYRFLSPYGRVQLSVRNKLQAPLYIQWKESALIVNEKRVPYYTPTMTVRGTVRGRTITWFDGFATTHAPLRATVVAQEEVSFVPPLSVAEFSLVDAMTGKLALGGRELQQKNLPTGGVIRYTNFEASASPVKFRSYLTFSRDREMRQVFRFDHAFWLGEVGQTGYSPSNMPEYRGRGDVFYVKRNKK